MVPHRVRDGLMLLLLALAGTAGGAALSMAGPPLATGLWGTAHLAAFVAAAAAVLGARATQRRDGTRLNRLVESRALYGAMLDASADCIKLLERDGSISYINATGQRLLEIEDCAAVLGQHFEALWPEGERPRLRAAIEAALGGAVQRFEAPCPTARGTPRWWDVTIAPLPGRNGRIERLVATGRDITDRRHDEAALAASEATLQAVLDAMPVGVCIADASGRVLRDNAAHRELWGMAPETADWQAYGEWVGWRPETGERIAAHEWAMARALLRGETSRGELVECERFGTRERRFYFNSAAPLRDAAGRIVGGVVAELDVTERRRAERALAESEARFRALAEATKEAIVLHEGGRIADCNDAYWRMFGLPSREAAIGRDVGELLAPEEHATEAAVVAAGVESLRETIGLRADGSRFPLEAEGRPVVYQGRPMRVGVLRDLTRWKAQEAALRASEARLRTIVETVPVGLVMAELPSGRIIGGNAQVERLLRHPVLFSQDIHAYGEWVAFHADGRRVESHEYPLARMALAGEENPSIEVHYQRGDGTRAWTRIMGRAVRDADGRLVGGVVALLDVDGERRASEARAEGERRLQLALDAGRMGTWDWDLASDRVAWDARMFELFDQDPAQFVPSGLAIVAMTDPEDRAQTEDALAAALAAPEGVFNAEFRIVLPGGERRWLGAYAHVLRGPDGRPARVVGLNQDITGRREAAAVLAGDKAWLEGVVAERTAALRESEARLAQAAKMEALGRLAGGVAHDFNNVLQAVQGGIALASKRLTRDAEAAARFLELAADATERGAAVTRRLLAFARRGELSAAPVEAGALLDGLAQILRHTLGPSVALAVKAPAALPALFADAGQLEAVLVNLANNARDALPGGCGSIILSAEATRHGLPEGLPEGLAAGDYIRLAVADDGEGMTPEVLARVTEPFFTTKPKGKGTGLGLAMARGFAEQSRGALTVDSAPGRGTTVSLWLPEASDAAGSHAPEGPAPSAPVSESGRQASVLLVDDEAGVRRTIAEALADRGHVVAEAEDGASALARLDAGVAADVLVTDLAMPGGMDGLALVRAARQRRPGLPAVLITGHAGDAGRAALREAAGNGPFAMLRKPASAEVVEAQIAALLREAAQAALRRGDWVES